MFFRVVWVINLVILIAACSRAGFEAGLDDAAPELAITAPVVEDVVSSASVIFFTNSDPHQPEVSIDQVNWVAAESGVTRFLDLSGYASLRTGAFTLTLRDTDLAGNTAAVSRTFHKDAENYSLDWRESRQVVVDGAALLLAGDVVGFPVLVRLSNVLVPDVVSRAESQGTDIRFAASDGTPLPYEIERWQAGSGGVVWVLLDRISSTQETTFRLFFDRPGAQSRSNSSAVFAVGDGFVGVWHLGNTADATQNGHHGSSQEVRFRPALIGHGGEFSTNRCIEIPSSKQLDLAGSDLSISAWVNTATEIHEERIIFEHTSGWQAGNYQLTVEPDASEPLHGELGFGLFAAPIDGVYVPGYPLVNTGWHLLVGRLSGLQAQLYTNGSLALQAVQATGIDSVEGPSYLGCRGGSLAFWDGLIDEVRVESVARSPDWIKLCHASQHPEQTVVQIRPF